MEHRSEFKYYGSTMDESDTDGVERRKKVVSDKCYQTSRGLQLECARVLHGVLLAVFFCIVLRQGYVGRRRVD